jgi:hypothetical protein
VGRRARNLPDELAAILGWNRTVRSRYEQFGATIVDATRPLAQVTDDILTASRSPHPTW